MNRITSFGRFLWDFIVGDDWVAAVGVVLAIGLTAFLAHHGFNGWIVMPVAVAFVMYLMVRRATR